MFIKCAQNLKCLLKQKSNTLRFNSMLSSCIVLSDVEGILERKNTVVYKPPKILADESTVAKNVIFFPGDVQDFEHVMQRHHMARDFVNWSYERTMNNLSGKFPHHAIWLLVPSKKAYGTICVYKNFVKSESIMGVPSHDCGFNGFRNLEQTINSAQIKVFAKLDSNPPETTLVGFSKGCVVLNQLLHELSADPSSESAVNEPPASNTFLNSIKQLYWLDGGHSGEKDVWVTNENVVNDFARSPLSKSKIFVHISPYQVRDAHRPWKGESEAEFVKLLRDKDLDVTEVMHFEDETPTIETHFKVLDVF